MDPADVSIRNALGCPFGHSTNLQSCRGDSFNLPPGLCPARPLAAPYGNQAGIRRDVPTGANAAGLPQSLGLHTTSRQPRGHPGDAARRLSVEAAPYVRRTDCRTGLTSACLQKLRTMFSRYRNVGNTSRVGPALAGKIDRDPPEHGTARSSCCPPLPARRSPPNHSAASSCESWRPTRGTTRQRCGRLTTRFESAPAVSMRSEGGGLIGRLVSLRVITPCPVGNNDPLMLATARRVLEHSSPSDPLGREVRIADVIRGIRKSFIHAGLAGRRDAASWCARPYAGDTPI